MMQDTGIQTPVGIKVKGPDVAIVGEVAQNVETLLKEVPGTQSVIAERIARGYFVDARLDLQRMAAHGVTVDEAMPTIQFAIGGDNVIGIRQPDKTVVPLAVQYSPEYVDTIAKVRNTPVITTDGRSVALSEIADVAVREAPEMIRNDNGDLAGYVYVYLDGVTAPEYVDRAQEYLRTRLSLPPGYAIEWTGLFRYTEDARATLRVVVPITLAIMFVLLVAAFRSVSDSVLIMLSAPFALVGGVLLQWYLGYSMTTAVIIGYVSLFAVAIQTGIIMIEFIREALARRPADTTVYGCGGRGLGRPAETEADDGGDDGAGTPAHHVRHRFGYGCHQADRHANVRGNDHVDDLRAVSHPLPVCHRCRRPQSLARTLRRALRSCRHDVRAGNCAGRLRKPGRIPGVGPASTGLPAAGSSDGLVVRFGTEPSPPAKGENSVQVTVTKSDGSPLTAGTVTAVFSMPAMPSMNMPAMRSDTALEHEGEGRYRGTGHLSMGGTWTVAITIADGSKEVATRQTSIVVKE